MENILREYDETLALVLDEAQSHSLYVVARLQRVRSRSVTVANGRIEGVATGLSQGIGLHVFDREGHTAFAATDTLAPDNVTRAVHAAAAGVRAAARAGLQRNTAIFDVAAAHAVEVPPTSYTIDGLELGDVQAAVEGINRELIDLGDGLKARTSFSIDREEWRIARSDGTDVRYVLPHGYCANSLTAQRDGATHTVGASLSRTGYEVLREERPLLLARSHNAAQTALRLLDAPRYAAGSYPLIIDYAMAKGLAHEAFGHAAETDGLRSSILGRDGRFRQGEQLGSPLATIIDEPLVGDHAYQPFSPNGLRRTRATIMEHGVLREALADLFSAAPAGTRPIDAARAQSYGSVPVPRMTNIRIEVPEPFPLSGRFEDHTPDTVREALINAGLLRHGRTVVYLAGYKGGQVSPAQGDFVFNCAALWELSMEGTRLFQPAIFSGRTEAALRSIAGGFGPLQLDAMGFCGKAGQSVPSSGGSHHFLYLEPNNAVTVG